MDLQSIWNRMDQLERLVLAQAREIEALRRLVGACARSPQAIECGSIVPCAINTQLGYNNNNRAKDVFAQANCSGEQQMHDCPVHRLTKPFGRRALLDTKSTATAKQQISPTSTFQPYLINSFVHPSTAVPPATLRPVVSSSARCNGANLTRWSIGPPSLIQATNSSSLGLELNHEDDTITDDYAFRRSKVKDRNEAEPILQTTHEPIKHVARMLDDVTDLEMTEDAARSKAKRHWGLVELLTCFCPCFTMC